MVSKQKHELLSIFMIVDRKLILAQTGPTATRETPNYYRTENTDIAHYFKCTRFASGVRFQVNIADIAGKTELWPIFSMEIKYSLPQSLLVHALCMIGLQLLSYM